MKTILTVDDSTSIRQMVSFTLKNAGYEVIEAGDGNIGLNQAKSNPCNLIITDQNMPGMDGLSMIKALRSLPSYKTTPILMLTTESSDAMKHGRPRCGRHRLDSQAFQSTDHGRCGSQIDWIAAVDLRQRAATRPEKPTVGKAPIASDLTKTALFRGEAQQELQAKRHERVCR